MEFRTIAYGSSDYDQMIALRDTVLRKPLGLQFTSTELEKDQPPAVLLGAFLQEELVGCCIISDVDASTKQLRQMAVQPHLQSSGIGSQLVHYVEQVVRNAGANTLVLHARKAAMAFYVKNGYSICSEEYLEVNIPHYTMQKKVAL